MIESISIAIYLIITIIVGLVIVRFVSNIEIPDDAILTPQVCDAISEFKTFIRLAVFQGIMIVLFAPWIRNNPIVMILMCTAFVLTCISIYYSTEIQEDDDNDNTPTSATDL